jgi:hypothetical protein
LSRCATMKRRQATHPMLNCGMSNLHTDAKTLSRERSVKTKK